ncbi:sufurtransferase FdhD [Verminephrobacter aporrectodeae subsp. tuberculatae]|uniref:formate dehydrogenase accessory sulfurtransferase FdhD n=1 Tax=Verminephrobacter aporrectodeae TaxID=1110389 RepID=UPI0022444C17|nr:formate dehydrogenase accessory sulfurtransferase FdhD [Verminephrobacter aporrectodeae]MCW8165399.1 sufurtransferase FdhD [Verminephrobacter aporrectodeae subsp. tuberculatae]MCW8169491.1 sufurtransferase FdhD [Verminephrobacter aporrectodeae subsp. tuberculatae]
MIRRASPPACAPPVLPRLTRAQAPLTHLVEVLNEQGMHEQVQLPAERPLTIYVDRRELVTLMTLGARPELLVLGYLRNQRLLESVFDVESVTVDWQVQAAAVRTRHGMARMEERTARKVVTTGCGQGSMFGGFMDAVERIALPAARLTQGQLYAIVNAIRIEESTYKSAGSVHACALFRGEELLIFVEDVGRHNAIDTIAGWMWMHSGAGGADANPAGQLPMSGADKVFYTTGRLTSEMIIKSAQMGVPIVVSRSGMTQMGHTLAQQLGLCAIGRATHRRFVCYSGAHRLVLQPELARPPIVPPAG